MASLLHAFVHWLLYTWFAIGQVCARAIDVLRHWSWNRSAVPTVNGFDIPRHLAVVFAWPSKAPNNTTLANVNAAVEDVVRLAQWSALAGIAELTMYDRDGLLARIFAKPSRLPSSDTNDWASMEIHFGRIVSQSPSSVRPLPQPVSYASPARISRVRVNLLSAADDKPALIDAFKHTKTWEPSAVSHTLYQAGPMSCEPSILMVCGDTAPAPHLHGFPAWSLRITTMGSLPSWAYLQRWTPAHFLDTLRLYTATEQRHGA